ncbi:MAG: HalX domain-containing protein [Betaproteobacteria bacterium]|nr:HalX domain-containing protein [Betaproteobacteria bacterium]
MTDRQTARALALIAAGQARTEGLKTRDAHNLKYNCRGWDHLVQPYFAEAEKLEKLAAELEGEGENEGEYAALKQRVERLEEYIDNHRAATMPFGACIGD